jgi:heme/copper-type cytochrome/quinol oxidase subunit 3
VTAVLDAPPRGDREVAGPRDPVVPPPPPPDGGDGWEQEPDPRRPLLDNALLGTLFLIGGELMFFAGLVSAFWVLRLAAPVWPPPLQPRLPVGVTGLNTLVLLGSSVAVAAGARALGRGDRRAVVRRLGLAAGLGTLFLVVQGTEWARLVHFGLTMTSGAYGATFYTLIGTHALHVAGALVWLAVTLHGVMRGRLTAARSAPLRASALYWHFVVGLWPILYVSVYLL